MGPSPLRARTLSWLIEGRSTPAFRRAGTPCRPPCRPVGRPPRLSVASCRVDAVDGLSADTAGEQAILLCRTRGRAHREMPSREQVLSLHMSAPMRRRGGQENCRRDRRTQCKPALHDATSRFLCWASIRRGRLFGKRNLAAAKRGVAATTTECAAAACCCPALKRSHGRKERESRGFKNTSLDNRRSAAIGSTLHSCAEKVEP